MILVRVRVISLDDVTKSLYLFCLLAAILTHEFVPKVALFSQTWRRNRRNNASRMRCFRYVTN